MMYFDYTQSLADTNTKTAKIQIFNDIKLHSHSVFYHDNNKNFRGGLWFRYRVEDFNSFAEMKREASSLITRLNNVRVFYAPVEVHVFHDERCFNVNLATSPVYDKVIKRYLELLTGRSYNEFLINRKDFDWTLYNLSSLLPVNNRVEVHPKEFLVATRSVLQEKFESGWNDKVEYFPIGREDLAKKFSQAYQEIHPVVHEPVEGTKRLIADTTARGEGSSDLPAIQGCVQIETFNYHNCIIALRKKVKVRRNFRRLASVLSFYARNFGLRSSNFIEDNGAIFDQKFNDAVDRDVRIDLFKQAYKRKGGKYYCQAMLNFAKCDCSTCLVWKENRSGDLFELPITVEDDGIYKVNVNGGVTRLSDFTIEPMYMLKGHQFNFETAEVEHITNYVARIRDYRGFEKVVVFHPAAFLTVTNLKRQLGSDFVWYGKDSDMVLLQQYIKHHTVESRVREATRGLHYENDVFLAEDEDYMPESEAERGKMMFVDYGGNIDQLDMRDKEVLFSGTNLPITHILKEKPLTKESCFEGIESLFLFNTPIVIAKCWGWMLACFLKERFFKYRFPFLFVGGEPGAGKTVTLSMFARLFCYDSEYVNSFPSIANITLPTMILSMSSSNMFPLFYNEFKRSFLDSSKMSYSVLANLLRNMYDSGVFARGERTLTHIREWKLVTPLALMGERFLEEDALSDRMEEVRMTKGERTPQHTEHFFKAAQFPLEKLGKGLLLHMMNIDREEIETAYETNLSIIGSSIQDRQRHNRSILLTGLDFMSSFLRSTKVKDESIRLLKYALLNEERVEVSCWDKETTMFVTRLVYALGRAYDPTDRKSHINTFALIPSYDRVEGIPEIKEGGRYVVCSVSALKGLFVRDLNIQKDKEAFNLFISDFFGIMRMVQGEPYCVKVRKANMGEGMKLVMVLDVDVMQKEGIDTSSLTNFFRKRT